MEEKMKFRSLAQIIKTFSDENVCRRFLEMQRWHGKPCCPKCKSDKNIWRIENNTRYKCKECNYKFSVRVGTIFKKSQITLGNWFTAIYLCTSRKKGISSIQLSKDLDISQKSAWFMEMRIRKILETKAPKLLKNIVEADETYYGGTEKNKHKDKKTKGTQGRNTETKTPIFGLIERKGDILISPVNDVKGKTLNTIINNNVVKGATISTDEWGAYNGLSTDYTHVKVEHGKGEFVNGIAHTNNLEGFWSHLKRGINAIQISVSPQHLHRYCDEYAYRYKTRNEQDGDRFTMYFKNIEDRLTYKQLIQK
jgi:transposase-like protein